MSTKQLASVFGKLILCGMAFFAGLAISGTTLPLLGFQPPAIPAGTDANMIATWFFAGSILLAFALSLVTSHLRAAWYVRWALLFALIWVIGAVCMVLESMFFMTTGAVASLYDTLYTLLNFLLPSLFLSGAITFLFRPSPGASDYLEQVQIFIQSRAYAQWLFRGLLVWLAYPLVYVVFGLMVEPFVGDFYIQGAFELTTPTWGQLIPLQLVRSLLILLVCLPFVIVWQGSRRKCWLAMSFSVFALTAFMAVLTSYWFPWQLRLFHGIELWLDALIYTGMLVSLMQPGNRVRSPQVNKPGIHRRSSTTQVRYSPN